MIGFNTFEKSLKCIGLLYQNDKSCAIVFTKNKLFWTMDRFQVVMCYMK